MKNNDLGKRQKWQIVRMMIVGIENWPVTYKYKASKKLPSNYIIQNYLIGKHANKSMWFCYRMFYSYNRRWSACNFLTAWNCEKEKMSEKRSSSGIDMKRYEIGRKYINNFTVLIVESSNN